MSEWWQGFLIGVVTTLAPSMIYLAILLWTAPNIDEDNQ